MYKNKYLKYKNKYLEAKKLSGGLPPKNGKRSPPPPPPPPPPPEPDSLVEIYDILNIPENIVKSRKENLSDLYNNIIINIKEHNIQIQDAKYKSPYEFLTKTIPKKIFEENKNLKDYVITNNVTDNELFAYVIFSLYNTTEIPLLIENKNKIYSIILNIDLMTKYKKYYKDFINHQLYCSLENNIIINSRINDTVEINQEIRISNNEYLKKLNVDSIKDELLTEINTILLNKNPEFKFGRQLTEKETLKMIIQFYNKYINSSYVYDDEPIELKTQIYFNDKETNIPAIKTINNNLETYKIINKNNIITIKLYIIERLLDKFNHKEQENSLYLTEFKYIHKLIKNSDFMEHFSIYLHEHSIESTYISINNIIDSDESNKNHDVRVPNNKFINDYGIKNNLLFSEIKCIAENIIKNKK